jgi:signal transduction histidine kinase
MATQHPVSVATKLTRMNMVVCATALILACTGFVAYDLSSFRDSIVRNLSIQSQVAGSNSVSALLFDDRSSAERTLAAFKLAPNIVSACIYKADGTVFTSYQRDAGAPIPANPSILPGQDEHYWFSRQNVMLVHTITFQGQPTGFVFIQSDLQTLRARLTRYVAIAAIMLMISLLAAFVVSRLSRKSVAEPIVSLAEVARHVSRDKDYSLRASQEGASEELSVLVEAFNEMLVQIQERDRSLHAAHRELEKRVEERTSELAAANRELESFSYSVSHDLRAPLRSIDGFSQALAEDYGDKFDSQGLSYIERVRAATQRMGLLIDDLLNLSRVTRAEIHREAVDLSGIARSVVAELAKNDGQRQVEWIIQDGVNASGDSRLLRVVLDNLLGNAWKYTSKHERARIEFGQTNSNGSSAYFVKDDGAGFDPVYSEKLFGAFQRLHKVTEFSGTGIGLATVHRIIHRHGGRVWAESAVEKGATFYFTL